MKKTITSERRQVIAGVIDNIDLAPLHPGHFSMTIGSEYLSAHAEPGQFLHILPPGSDDMLRRPLSVMMADPDRQTFTLLYRVIGEGTKLLSSVKPGDKIDIIGPLGNGFPVEGATINTLLGQELLIERIGRTIIAGGGVGIPPLVYLAKKLLDMGRSADSIEVYLGARDIGTLVCVEEFNKLGIKPVLTLESEVDTLKAKPLWENNGIVRGFVTDALDGLKRSMPPDAIVYSCGPIPMLIAVFKWACRNILPCYVSLENKLGCGIGACLGCSIPIHDSVGTIHYERVCCEGPVFDATRVAFHKML